MNKTIEQLAEERYPFHTFHNDEGLKNQTIRRKAFIEGYHAAQEQAKYDLIWKMIEDFQQMMSAWQNHITEIEIDALLKAGRLMDFTRVPINQEQVEIVRKKVADGGNSWLPFDNGKIPTPAEVNEWNRKGMGHDSINKWICVEARAKHLGVYGECEVCGGEGELWQSDEIKKLHDDWKDFDPPTGEGFQLWETTSEGSPESPVFQSLEALCVWCEDNATTFGTHKTSKENWFKMLSDDHVYHQEGTNIFF